MILKPVLLAGFCLNPVFKCTLLVAQNALDGFFDKWEDLPGG